jgi:hypothetical protein
MTFLTPLPMLIALGLGLPALTLLYILRLRRRPIRVSSTLLWEQAVRDLEVNEPFRRFQPSLLFLLHALILSLFALAMGRPVLDTDAARAQDVVLVLDRSASMSATDAADAPTRLDAAKAAATARVRALHAAAPRSFAVIAYAAEPLFLGRADNPADAAALIAAITPTDQPGNPAAALELADTVARADNQADNPTDDPMDAPRGAPRPNAGGEPAATTDPVESNPIESNPIESNPGESEAVRAPAIIEFFSDSPAEPALLDASPLRPRLTRIGPDAAAGNVGLVAFSAVRDDPDNPARVRVYARVQSTLDRPIALPLSLRVGTRPPERTTLRVPLASGDSAGLIPASASRTFEVLVPPAAPDDTDRTITLSIDRDDALPADNTAGLVLPPLTTPSIALLAPAGPSGEPAPDPFLLNVLDALADRTERLFTPDAAERLTTAPGAADLLVFDRVAPPAWPVTPSIFIGVPAPGIPTRTVPAPVTPLLRWDRLSPILRDVALDSVILGRRLVIDPESPEARAAAIRTLAETADGTVIASFEVDGVRHLWIGFELAQSNWPVQVSFPVVLAAATDTLSPRSALDAAPRRTSEPVRVLLPRAGAGGSESPGPVPTARVLGPDASTRSVPVTPAGIAGLGLVERVGTYRVRLDGTPDTQPWVLAPVNLLDAAESTLALPPPAASGPDANDNTKNDAGRTRGPRSIELWRPLILAALVLLAVEWLVFARSAHVTPHRDGRRASAELQ